MFNIVTDARGINIVWNVDGGLLCISRMPTLNEIYKVSSKYALFESSHSSPLLSGSAEKTS